VQKLTPCLWFDTQAEEAAKFYCSIFDHSKITGTPHFGKAGQEFHAMPEGMVLTDPAHGNAEKLEHHQVSTSL